MIKKENEEEKISRIIYYAYVQYYRAQWCASTLRGEKETNQGAKK